jgi:hypothetical protein
MNAMTELAIPRVYLTLPESFMQIPLDADEEARAARIGALVERGADVSGGTVDAEQIFQALVFLVTFSENLVDEGAQLAALMLAPRADGNGFDHFTLAMALAETDLTPPETAVQGTLEIVQRRTPSADVRLVDLPCGPAVASVEVGAYHFPAEINPAGNAVELPQGKFQMHIPIPGEPWMAIFDMTTTALDDWADSCMLVAAIMQTVSFAEPVYNEDGLRLRTEPWKPDYGATSF